MILQELGFAGNFPGISFKDILEVITDEQVDLPARTITPSGEVKLPFNRTISHKEFMSDMERRKANSKYLKL